MSVPFFGPSQRVEISTSYLHNNHASDISSASLLYPRIDAARNVAEAGQVVLLESTTRVEESGSHEKLGVIPDAAGYRVNYNPKSVPESQLRTLLMSEINKFHVGVNQVEKGVGVAHQASGYGWDISFTPGQPAHIMHTGSEPIHRFDYVAVRFPTPHDQKCQEEMWHKERSHYPSLCKFATYPIRENWESMKYTRFHHDLDAFRCHNQIACVRDDGWNPLVKYSQLPALFRLIGKVVESYNKDESHIKEQLQAGMNICADTDFEDSPLIANENGFLTTLGIAKAAIDFVYTLRPPHVIAQCLDFHCAQPHMKGHAQCGDTMKCILL